MKADAYRGITSAIAPFILGLRSNKSFCSDLIDGHDGEYLGT